LFSKSRGCEVPAFFVYCLLFTERLWLLAVGYPTLTRRALWPGGSTGFAWLLRADGRTICGTDCGRSGGGAWLLWQRGD